MTDTKIDWHKHYQTYSTASLIKLLAKHVLVSSDKGLSLNQLRKDQLVRRVLVERGISDDELSAEINKEKENIPKEQLAEKWTRSYHEEVQQPRNRKWILLPGNGADRDYFFPRIPSPLFTGPHYKIAVLFTSALILRRFLVLLLFFVLFFSAWHALVVLVIATVIKPMRIFTWYYIKDERFARYGVENNWFHVYPARNIFEYIG